jgi:hypothetical protein
MIIIRFTSQVSSPQKFLSAVRTTKVYQAFTISKSVQYPTSTAMAPNTALMYYSSKLFSIFIHISNGMSQLCVSY